MNEIAKRFKQILCKHAWGLNRWHYTHGFNGNEPAFIEAECICLKCGKISYTYAKLGGAEEEFCKSVPEKQW